MKQQIKLVTIVFTLLILPSVAFRFSQSTIIANASLLTGQPPCATPSEITTRKGKRLRVLTCDVVLSAKCGEDLKVAQGTINLEQGYVYVDKNIEYYAREPDKAAVNECKAVWGGDLKPPANTNSLIFRCTCNMHDRCKQKDGKWEGPVSVLKARISLYEEKDE